MGPSADDFRIGGGELPWSWAFGYKRREGSSSMEYSGFNNREADLVYCSGPNLRVKEHAWLTTNSRN